MKVQHRRIRSVGKSGAPRMMSREINACRTSPPIAAKTGLGQTLARTKAICRAQRPHIDATLAESAMAGALLLSIDFHSQKDPQRRLSVRQQSTIIVFRGAEERGRAVGITNAAEIRALILLAA